MPIFLLFFLFHKMTWDRSKTKFSFIGPCKPPESVFKCQWNFINFVYFWNCLKLALPHWKKVIEGPFAFESSATETLHASEVEPPSLFLLVFLCMRASHYMRKYCYKIKDLSSGWWYSRQWFGMCAGIIFSITFVNIFKLSLLCLEWPDSYSMLDIPKVCIQSGP